LGNCEENSLQRDVRKRGKNSRNAIEYQDECNECTLNTGAECIDLQQTEVTGTVAVHTECTNCQPKDLLHFSDASPRISRSWDSAIVLSTG
jgi:hypothetical protein